MFAEIHKEYLRYDIPCPLAMVVCSLGAAEVQNAIHRPDGFYYHQLLWVTAGEGVFGVGGTTRVLGKGQGLFCRSNVPHSYEREGAVFSTKWLSFRGAEGLLDYFSVPDYFFFEATEALVASTVDLERMCQESSDVVSRSAAGYSMLTNWLSMEFGAPASPAEKIRKYMETHFASPLTLEDIGREVGMDRFSLCRYYRESQGITVMDQLKRIRIAKAKQYLRHASSSVEEIGALCGYNSPSYFGKIFREETGVSPREYRERYRK